LIDRFGHDATTSLLSCFSCPKNPDVEDFLIHKAIEFERSHNARTRLILDEQGAILAYFSLSFKELVIDDFTVSKSQVKKMDGFSKNAEKIRAFLIGQLGKNNNIEDNPISLDDILNELYAVIHEVRTLIGGRIIILECENKSTLIELYKRHGFKVINVEAAESDPLITMYTYISE
jgi:hypothetical protein